MKFINIKAIAPTAALALALSMTSCMKDLEDGNINPNVEATVSVQGLYNKCYAGLIMEGNDGSADFSIDDAGKSTLLRNLFNFNELCTDESICWWSDGGIQDLSYNQVTPGHASLKFLYYRLMSNITFCNQFLDESQVPGSTPQQRAEIRAIRAYEYMLMLDFFGDAPFVTKIQTEAPKQAHAFYDDENGTTSSDRKTMLDHGRKYLYSWIESELKSVLDDESLLAAAAPKKSTESGYGTITKGAVWLLLSRLYLNAEVYTGTPQWKEAKEYAEKLLNNSSYSLWTGSAGGYQSYDMLFMGDNGESGASCEAILPLIQDRNTTRGWGGSLFFVASFWNNSMLNVKDQHAQCTDTWSGMRVRPEFAQLFADEYDGEASDFVGKKTSEIRAMNFDDRCLLWGKGTYHEEDKQKGTPAYYDDDRTLDLGNNDGFINGLATTKWNNNYTTKESTNDGDAIDTDYFLFRFAEAYFNYVEADLRLNGNANISDDIAKMNLLRTRAHSKKAFDTYNDGTHEKLSLETLLNEKAREFYCEGQRRTDLIRYGYFGGTKSGEYIWSYKGGQKAGATFGAEGNVYPLPTSEIEANSNLTQIYGY